MFPSCNKSLIGDLISGNEDKKFGFIAHIVGEKPNGPRGDPVRSLELADDPANLMLLCHKHHKLIDDPDTRDEYPEELLLEYRRLAADRIELVTSIDAEKSTLILLYGAKIGVHGSPISFQECATAVLPNRYSQDRRGVEIAIKGTAETDGDDKYWPTEIAALKTAFEREVHPRIKDGSVKHLSVFGLAPIPLLVELGRQLGDINNVDVFQRHREPEPSWKWPVSQTTVDYELIPPKSFDGRAVLKLEISANFSDDRVVKNLGEEVSIWRLRAQNANLDIIKNRRDLSNFRNHIRGIFDNIKARHGENSEIDIFPAVPVSIAIEIGRCWMPKADLPLNIYDHRADIGSQLRTRIE